MKTLLRLLLVFSIVGVSSIQSNAQCTVSNILIQNVTGVAQTSSSCTVRFDVSFNIQNNGGNKYIFIHAWIQEDYPNYFDCVNGQPSTNGSIAAPEGSDLADAFLNIGINNNLPTPVILTTYPPDPSVPMTTVASIERQVLPDGSANITLRGVVTTLPVACGTPVVVIADLWSSQSANAQRAHCVNCGIMYSAGYLSLTGLANCANLTFNATITNNTSAALSGFYRVYVDMNGDGTLSPSSDVLIQGPTPFSVTAGMGMTTSISGPIPSIYMNKNLFIVITQNSGSGSGASRVFLILSTQCGPLPVTFSSFTATRFNQSMVTVRWETATEINNSGFAVERNMGNNNWQMLGFIQSQANGGNSNSPLTYVFNDINNMNKGITQYRIKQVDLDNKAKFSEIRAVRGYGQDGKTIVYPNPSPDGRINVVFEDNDGTRDISLSDMYGRIIRQWQGVSENNLQINSLGEGIYSLRIFIRETGAVTTEKIVVTNQ